VTNLITKAFAIDTVWNIKYSIRKGFDLVNLNVNIKRIMLHRHAPKGHFNKESVNNENKEEIQKN